MINLEVFKLQSLFKKLNDKNVQKLTPEETQEIEKSLNIEKEVTTGMAGPIKVFSLVNKNEMLVLEHDQKGLAFCRLIEGKFVQEFIKERLNVYEKMWDGCGCKVFYDELWIPKENDKEKEISI